MACTPVSYTHLDVYKRQDFAQEPLGPRYRLHGNKMWISAGEHALTENIVHLVLAKVPDASGQLPPGVKGISLFIVPKVLVELPVGALPKTLTAAQVTPVSYTHLDVYKRQLRACLKYCESLLN